MTQANADRHQKLKQSLAKQRQMMSLVEKEVVSASPQIEYNSENWVRAYIDTGHAISFDKGVTTAYRGITLDGQLFWMVRHIKKKFGYHSCQNDPLAAVEEAETAWAGRHEVRRNWDEVEQIRRDLFNGRLKFTVLVSDAHASPLCGLGVDAFMQRHGLGTVKGIPGRLAALLMKIEPQVGFAIYQAYVRETAEAQMAALNTAADGSSVQSA